MAEQKLSVPANFVQTVSHIKSKKENSDVHPCFPKKQGLFTQTHHVFTHGHCCVSAILDLLLQFWTSAWCC